MPWLESCGLYGLRVGVTDVTFTFSDAGVERGVAAGVALLQPSAMTPLTTDTGTTNHGLIALRMVTESTKGEDVAPVPEVMA